MPAGQTPGRWYPDEFKQMVLRWMLDAESYTEAKECLDLNQKCHLKDATCECLTLNG